MKRLLKFGGLLAAGWAGIWIVLFSPALFLVAVVIGLVVRLLIVMDQRDEAADEAVGLSFALTSAEAEARQIAGDYDAVVRRLAEVLDEHALCPVPVQPEVVAPYPRLRGAW